MEKNKAGKRDRRVLGMQFKRGKRVVRESHTDKPKENEAIGHVAIQRKNFLDR